MENGQVKKMVSNGLFTDYFSVSSAQFSDPCSDATHARRFLGWKAEWVVDVPNVGLPVGESDTLYKGNGEFWSYLHASDQSAGVIDQCGDPVAFPGCTTLWQSIDGGKAFNITAPVCLMQCTSCPCDDQRDHITAQQYPRVVDAGDRQYMAYEWHAQIMLRSSTDGLNWSDWKYLLTPGGTWPTSYKACTATETIGPTSQYTGAGRWLLGGCAAGAVCRREYALRVRCGGFPRRGTCAVTKGIVTAIWASSNAAIPIHCLSGAGEYGPIDITSGSAIDAYFDFRYVSAADVLKVGDHYYMSYEGIRGPDVLERGMDTQFGLGFARSVEDAIDGAWER